MPVGLEWEAVGQLFAVGGYDRDSCLCYHMPPLYAVAPYDYRMLLPYSGPATHQHRPKLLLFAFIVRGRTASIGV